MQLSSNAHRISVEALEAQQVAREQQISKCLGATKLRGNGVPVHDAKWVIAKISNALVFRPLGLFPLPAWVKGVHLRPVVSIPCIHIKGHDVHACNFDTVLCCLSGKCSYTDTRTRLHGGP